jgi:uncharacterized protein YihD (DUF1040 family)
MPRIIIQKNQYDKVYNIVSGAKETRNKVITLRIKCRNKPVKAGDLLHFYWYSIVNNRLTKIGVLVCKDEITTGKEQILTIQNTYDRKYYLNRKVKKAGFGLELGELTKTILVPPELMNKAKKDVHVRELKDRYNYGVQFTLV